MTRPTNPELVANFRALLTEGALKVLDKDTLVISKPYREALWNAFNEIEERLCPLEVETRRRLKEANK